jgi:hypothetical protein
VLHLPAAMMQRRISENRFAHIYFENEAFRFSFVAQPARLSAPRHSRQTLTA